MKLHTLLTGIFCLIIFTQLNAQKKLPIFNEISEEEWALERYDKDPQAEAVVLFDKGDTRFVEYGEGYRMRFTRHKRIKILDKSGDKHASVAFLLQHESYDREDELISLRAYTYNMVDGAVQGKKVTESNIFEESYEERWKRKTFTFPDVQEGSILEYEYVIESPFFFYLPDWEFQSDIPVIYSEYVVRTIPFYEYIYIAQGFKKFDYFDSSLSEKARKYPGPMVTGLKNQKPEFKDVVNTYAMEDLPAFRDESFITSRNHYIKRIDFQLSKVHSPYNGTTEYMTTWPKMVEDLLDEESFGKYLKSSENQAAKLLKSGTITDGENEIRDMRKVITYVKNNYNWNKKYRVYAENNARQFVSRKEGNMAEINLFLCGMLRAAGYEAHPVILSTRRHGKVFRQYPFLHYFNAVVVLINHNGKIFLTDASDPLTPFDMIPVKCMNEMGLIISEQNSGWVSLLDNKSSITTYNNRITIDTENMEAESTVSIVSSLNDAYIMRSEIGDDKETFEKLLKDHGHTEVKQMKFSGTSNLSRPFLMAANTSTELETIGERIIISPFAGFPISENPLKSDTRSYPVDFIYPQTENFITLIELPEGYKPDKLPENFAIKDELVDISINYSAGEGQLTVSGHYSFLKSIYQTEEYQQIKKHMESIVQHFNKTVVLKNGTTR